jgi:hypothetical protein
LPLALHEILVSIEEATSDPITLANRLNPIKALVFLAFEVPAEGRGVFLKAFVAKKM